MKKFIGTITIAMLLMMPLTVSIPVIAQPTMKLSDAVGGGTGGTFYLSPSILYYGGVAISGNTWIYGNGAMIDLQESNIVVTGKYLYIERCTITNGTVDSGAIEFLDGASGFVYHNIIVGNNDDGIYIEDSSDIIIKENSIIQNDDDGIYFDDSTDITILENTIANNGDEGIDGDNEDLMYDSPYYLPEVNELHNIIIKGNTIIANGDDGIELDYVNGVSIASNLIASNSSDGIDLDDCPIVSIINNKILANDDDAIYYDGDDDWPIVDVDGTDVEVELSLTISYNKIMGNDDEGMDIYYTQNVVITYNEIAGNNDEGIYLDGDFDGDYLMEPVLIAYNTIRGNEENGIDMDYVSDVSILFNKIVGNDDEGIYIDGEDGSEGLLIKGNIVNENFDEGMDIDDFDAPVIIEWNTILGNEYEGLELDYLESPLIIHNTIMYNYDGGTDISYCDGARIAYNTISYNSDDPNIDIDGDGTDPIEDVIIEHNTIIGCGDDDGIDADYCYDMTIQYNKIYNNEDDGIDWYDSSGLITNNIIGYGAGMDTLSGNDDGIYLSTADTTTISDNIIIGNYEGIYCYDSDPTIIRNYIANNVYGIWLDGDSDATIGDSYDNRNYIIRNFADGIHIDSDDSDPIIRYNNIYWNVNYGVYSVFQTHTDHDKENGYIDAEYNWWGAMDGPGGVGPVTPDGVGPGHGDEVTDYIDYIPWLTALIP
ncbi:MAG: right-handed parallel beta-helix repeat-containing protein [archaeon]|nr:right-handed parallel beta-helix repeat-containing protein [archaeon]